MHAGLRELLKGGIASFGIVCAGDDDRRGAVLQKVDLISQGWIRGMDILQQVGYRPSHAMALSLPGNDDGIHSLQRIDELVIVKRRGPRPEDHASPRAQ